MQAMISSGEWIAIIGILIGVLTLLFAVVGGLWKIAMLLGKITETLVGHERRLDILDTALTEGAQAAKRRKRELGLDRHTTT